MMRAGGWYGSCGGHGLGGDLAAGADGAAVGPGHGRGRDRAPGAKGPHSAASATGPAAINPASPAARHKVPPAGQTRRDIGSAPQLQADAPGVIMNRIRHLACALGGLAFGMLVGSAPACAGPPAAWMDPPPPTDPGGHDVHRGARSLRREQIARWGF
jgi:hypothetical protein